VVGAVRADESFRPGGVCWPGVSFIGGNTLDALNLVVGDVAYRSGSLFHAAGRDELFLTGAALLMTTVLLAGLLVRQRHGPWRPGFDGVLLATIYTAALVTLAF
jgi:cation:H+ antiporter